MGREHYKLYSERRIGKIRLPNRLVRSATWDPILLNRRSMIDDVLEIYRNLAAGGVGLIITGGLTVFRDSDPSRSELLEKFLNIMTCTLMGLKNSLMQFIHNRVTVRFSHNSKMDTSTRVLLTILRHTDPNL